MLAHEHFVRNHGWRTNIIQQHSEENAKQVNKRIDSKPEDVGKCRTVSGNVKAKEREK
jgi:hypothetical protein